jgi:hypothetical protein
VLRLLAAAGVECGHVAALQPVRDVEIGLGVADEIEGRHRNQESEIRDQELEIRNKIRVELEKSHLIPDF